MSMNFKPFNVFAKNLGHHIVIVLVRLLAASYINGCVGSLR